MEPQYFVVIDGQQRGPYYLDELWKVGLERDTLVWCEGQAAWLPARSMPVLAEYWAESRNADARRGPRRPPAYLDRPYRLLGRVYPFVLAAFFFSIIFVLLGLLVADTERAAVGRDRMLFWLRIGALVCSVLGSFLLTGYLIGFLVLLYRVTVLIQDGQTAISLGKAVGFLFIPILQTIWIFVVFFGLARALNRYADRHMLIAPRASVLLGLAIPIYFVLTPVPYVGNALAFINLLLLPIFVGSIYRTASCFCTGNERFTGDDEPVFGPLATRTAWCAGLAALVLPLIGVVLVPVGLLGTREAMAETEKQRRAFGKKWEDANRPIVDLVKGRPDGNVMPEIPPRMQARVRAVEEEEAAFKMQRLLITLGFAALLGLGALGTVAAIPLASLARRSNAAAFAMPPSAADAPSPPPSFSRQ